MTEVLKRKITENPMAMLYLVIVACGTFFYNYQKSCDESAVDHRKMIAEMSKRGAESDAELAKQIALLNQNIQRLLDNRK